MELALLLPIAITWLVGFLVLSKLILLRQRAIQVAWFGANLRTTGQLDPVVINQETLRYAQEMSAGTVVRSDGKRFLELPAASFYRLFSADVEFEVPRPAFLGGGSWRIRERAVLQEEPLP